MLATLNLRSESVFEEFFVKGGVRSLFLFFDFLGFTVRVSLKIKFAFVVLLLVCEDYFPSFSCVAIRRLRDLIATQSTGRSSDKIGFGG